MSDEHPDELMFEARQADIETLLHRLATLERDNVALRREVQQLRAQLAQARGGAR